MRHPYNGGYRRRAEEDLDEVPELKPEEELIELLESIEQWQHRLVRDRSRLAALLGYTPDLQQRWDQFTRQGGITAKEFEAFLDGKFRARITRQRRHLRLVSSRKGVIMRAPRSNDPEAA
jgi:hypothetical protein